ncbi:serine/threonine phosphatase 2C (macronuclear) [Tetrahymena thermophila SB210]|uniref:Protein phosphatase n=1 Tax=Tetrahymena thermophila (strain SB210) TaxID=312017 RepID=Q23WR9_TETTS|nr:serine/threonine phosphatase 2C [Tetrahymena thermophila SB210]EAS01026.1 serine/threonine phosphatase 2C [Tetrahymena thermophila SB210]|eukprot:XP_001021271.1 serine/threonine phosphatase 2C [Tetrahymena thermophila SB210]
MLFAKKFKNFFTKKRIQITGGVALSFGLLAYIQHQNQDSSCREKKHVNYFDFSVQVLPHPDKIAKGGEDAYFADKNLLAVADGVGGWAEKGIDPAEYSRGLIRNVEQNYKSNVLKYISNPKLLLIHSAQATQIMGSSTLVLVTVDQEKNILKTSYIGDSGYCIYRLDEHNSPRLVFGFKEQQKSFNFPYQLGGMGNGDNPSTALEFEHEIKDKDIVIVGSDGLFDNMSFEQIRQQITQYVMKDKIVDVQSLAKDIGGQAKTFSLSWLYDSPFAQKARASKHYYMGGKSDDITVIVGQVRTD